MIRFETSEGRLLLETGDFLLLERELWDGAAGLGGSGSCVGDGTAFRTKIVGTLRIASRYAGTVTVASRYAGTPTVSSRLVGTVTIG